MSWLLDRATRQLTAELSDHLTPLESRLRQRAIAAVARAVALDTRHDYAEDDALIAALAHLAERGLAELSRLEGESSALLVSYQRALDQRERRELLARTLTATALPGTGLRQDVAAVKRWLDVEALRERSSTRVSDHVDEVLVCYGVIRSKLGRSTDPAPLLRAARDIGLFEIALRHAGPAQKAVVRNAALATLAALARALPPASRAPVLGVSALRSALRWAHGNDAARWTQVAALELCALCLTAGALAVLLDELLASRGRDDGMVIRAAAVRCLAQLESPRRFALARRVLSDPSEHVRQELARAFGPVRMPGARRILLRLALRDGAARVRGLALRELARRGAWDAACVSLAQLALARCLAASEPALVTRVALAAVVPLVRATPDAEAPRPLYAALAALAGHGSARPEVAEQAAAVLRELEVSTQAELAALAMHWRATLAGLREGESARVELAGSESAVLRALRVAARGDHAVGLSPLGKGRYRVTRGEPRGLRLWRLLHELLSPMPDKRRGYVHSRARVALGRYVVPPVGMAEVTPTRVHGERLLHGSVGGWATFLPRVDDLLDSALRRRPLWLLTAFGTVVVQGPPTLHRRLRAFLWLTRNYARAAGLRESSLEAKEASGQSAFVARARALGFTIQLEPSDASLQLGSTDIALQPRLPLGYLGLVGTLGAFPTDVFQQFFVHALSPNANEPRQLAIVVWLVFAVFVVRAAAIMQSITGARARIPLSIGGWGTRGKSGSERLKAALFHALRYDVVVKTTGCEAMFIHAQRDLPAQEIFIYRPYDKATIWEQRNMLDVAAKLRAQVFLWECMALQPRLVDTLIDEWMQDPITTLTNAYPDHEDIQGPSGEDVARVIGRFMPRGGVTFTTEEQMLPLLVDAARNKGTQLVPVEPLEAELLPSDLLDRLPYQEHPRNVALILRLAEHLGVDREFALVEIADHVILDLGVLKTYPEVAHRGRRLVFSNGMSANERAGFMSNWTRLEFDRHDVDADDATATVLVVNNRADRVARSRVFAQILVDDAAANAVILINSNLGGMLGFITSALDERLRTLSVNGDGGPERILERFDAHMRWLKVPGRPDALERSLARMLVSLGLSTEAAASALEAAPFKPLLERADAEALGTELEPWLTRVAPDATDALRGDILHHLPHLARRIRRMRQCRDALSERIAQGDVAGVDALARAAYRELFLDRIHILWNTGATGDQVIDFVTQHVPPGSRARLMGSQNIKGTGLDFVYRWLSVDSVEQRLAHLDTPALRQETLAWLASYSDFGLLDATRARDALHAIRESQDPSWAALEHLLTGASVRLEQLVQDKTARLKQQGSSGPWAKAFAYVEGWIDHLDSARRSHFAARVLRDLFAARIGHGRAALLLREVTARQKGGWLFKDFKKLMRRA